MKQLKFIIGTVILGLIASCSTNNEEKSNENKVGKDQLNPIVGYLYTSTMEKVIIQSYKLQGWKMDP